MPSVLELLPSPSAERELLPVAVEQRLCHLSCCSGNCCGLKTKAPQLSLAEPPPGELLLLVDLSAYLIDLVVVRDNCLHYCCHYVYCRWSLQHFRSYSSGRRRCDDCAGMQPSLLHLEQES